MGQVAGATLVVIEHEGTMSTQDEIYRDPISRELLAIASEMRQIAAHRARNNPQPDTLLSSWAGRIERAVINGETPETIGIIAAEFAKLNQKPTDK